jgi:transporter family protein
MSLWWPASTSSSVVLVALFGVIFLGERLSGLNWLGVAFIGGRDILVAYRG